MKIDKRMVEALQDPETTADQRAFFEERLREKLEALGRSSARSVYLFIFVSGAWFVINSAKANVIRFMGLEFTDINFLIFVLPVIASFAFYRHMCQSTFSALIDMVLRRYYAQILRPFWKRDLTEFISPLTFLDIEHNLSNMQTDTGTSYRLNRMWTIACSFVGSLVPPIILFYMVFIVFLNNTISTVWAIVCAICVAMLTIRSGIVWLHQYRELRK